MARGGYRPGAGRPKGSLGKATKAVQEKLEELNFDPIAALVETYRTAQDVGEVGVAARVAAELASYVAPKLKSIEHSSAGENGLQIHVITGIEAPPGSKVAERKKGTGQ